MLRSLKEVVGYNVQATNGKIGDVRDFYFDDLTWNIRYHVVDTGKWLPGRRVLVSPEAFKTPDWRGQVFPVSLTREQVEKSPPINTDKPVSHQHETELRQYYGWPVYPRYATPFAPSIEHASPGMSPENGKQEKQEAEGDPHLRSALEVIGYHIEATDGEIGHVEDFVADTDTWTIRYMVVDTRNWLPGKKVLVSPLWIDAVKWSDRSVRVELPRDVISTSPEFDPSQPVNREYEEHLYDYYGRPHYW